MKQHSTQSNRRGLTRATAAILVALCPALAAAASSNWYAEVGPGIAVFPKYPGSRAETVWPLPTANIRYGDYLYFDTRRGLGVSWLNEPNLRIGASMWVRRGRHRGDSDRVAALEDIGTAAKAQVFVTAIQGPAVFNAALVRDIGGSDGLTLEMSALWRCDLSHRFHSSLGVTVAVVNRQFMRTWFGITPEQSAASGLPQYSPGGGMKSLGPVAAFNYALTDRWSLDGAASYEALLVKAADSPVVERRGLPTLTIAFTYRFAP